MIASFARATITVVEPAAVDDGHNNLIPDWDDTTDTAVPGCSVQPGTTDEDLANRDGVTVRWTVYAPLATTVTAHSGVRLGGVLYQVEGEPDRWSSPTGALDHVVIRLVDWRG